MNNHSLEPPIILWLLRE